MNTMAIHAEAVEILVHEAHLEPEVALGIAEAIEVSINLKQVVTIPVLDARLQELRHDIKSDFAEMRADMATMRTEMISEFGRMRADMADQIGKVRAEMASEFGKVRAEIGEVRTEMASEFGKVRAEMAGEFGKVRAEMAGEFGKVRTETQAVKADLMRWVLLTLVSSAAVTAAVTPLVKGFIN